MRYDFVELESEQSFSDLGKWFGGNTNCGSLYFDNALVKGTVMKLHPEPGLYIRKWKLTIFEKIVLNRITDNSYPHEMFSLIYFVNPSIFALRSKGRKFNMTCNCNNIIVANNFPIEFSVMQRQPFYVLEVTVTSEWILNFIEQYAVVVRQRIEEVLTMSRSDIVSRPCHCIEYRALFDIDEILDDERVNSGLVSSHIHDLLENFFNKFIVSDAVEVPRAFHYDQLVQAHDLIRNNLHRPLTVNTIAKKLNMSLSSLQRHFKKMYGKSLQAYYLQKRMELAYKMIMDKGMAVAEAAKALGYNHASPFIEMFVRQFGCSPGSLKLNGS